MSMPTGPDPIDRLRAADPIRADEVPDASLARVSARIQEHIVTDIQHTSTAAPSRRPLALAARALSAWIRVGLNGYSPAVIQRMVPSGSSAGLAHSRENRTTLKISRKSIFGLLCCCVPLQRHYGGP